MDPRDLGRRAALLHLKRAAEETGASSTAPTTATPAAKTSTPGASTAANFGARPIATAAPPPAVPPVPPALPAAQVASQPSLGGGRPGFAAASPPPSTAPVAGGGLGGLATPAGLAGLIANPAVRGIAEPALRMGGFPLLAGGANLLRGGGDMANILRGKPA